MSQKDKDEATRKAEYARRCIQRGVKAYGMTPQRMIAVGILEDVLDRRDIKHQFEACDSIVIQEILAAWEEIARVVIFGEILQ